MARNPGLGGAVAIFKELGWAGDTYAESERLQRAVDAVFDDGLSRPIQGPDDPLVAQICDLAVEGDHAHLRREWGRQGVYPEDPVPEEDWHLCRDGLLALFSQGSTFMTALVINGPYRGRVVNLDDSMSFQPFLAHESNFLDYYERWLGEYIAAPGHRPETTERQTADHLRRNQLCRELDPGSRGA